MGVHKLTGFIEYLRAQGYSRTTIENYSYYERLIEALEMTQNSIDEFLAEFQFPMPRAALKKYLEYKGINGIIVRKMRGREKKRIPKALTFEEVMRLTEHADLRSKCMILLSFEGGLRVSELCNLMKEDIDMVNRRVRGIGKGNKEFIMLFSRQTSDFLTSYMEKVPDFTKLFGIGRKRWAMILNKIGKEALNKKVNPHMLRHSTATYLRQKLDTFELQNYMRHESISSTGVYVHIRTKDNEEKIRAVLDKQDGVI